MAIHQDFLPRVFFGLSSLSRKTAAPSLANQFDQAHSFLIALRSKALLQPANSPLWCTLFRCHRVFLASSEARSNAATRVSISRSNASRERPKTPRGCDRTLASRDLPSEVVFGYFPARCPGSRLFSLQINSMISSRGARFAVRFSVHGFTRTFGSSTVASTSRCPKSGRRIRSVKCICSECGTPIAFRVPRSLKCLPPLFGKPSRKIARAAAQTQPLTRQAFTVRQPHAFRAAAT
jgi:hypothetical protein